MNQVFEEVVTENPMLIEVSRVRRKLVLNQGTGLANKVVMSVLGLTYLGLLLLTMRFLGDIPPITLIIGQTCLFTLLAPMMLYGTIAGERERRSWDLLLAAPLSKAQIVSGKFLGALAGLGIGAALFLPPILMTALTFRSGSIYDAMLAETMSISFLAMVCAFTVFVSGRARRSLVALGTVLGTLATCLFVIPALAAVIFPNNNVLMEYVFFLHPFTTLAFIMEAATSRGWYGHVVSPLLYGWPQIVAYLSTTVLLLMWSSRTLTKADNEVALPRLRKRKNA